MAYEVMEMVSTDFIRKISNLDPQIREAFLDLIDEVKRITGESVKREDFLRFVEQTNENFNRVWAVIHELAEAQKRTEEELRKLAQRMAFVEERLEGLSNSVGYGLENQIYKYLSSILKRDFNIEVDGRLRRRYLDVGGKRMQVNIFGYGLRGDERLMIVGECKVRMSNRELNTFLKRIRKIERHEGIKVFPVVVAHDFTPEMQDKLEELRIAYYWSFDLE